jgi:hypothetical protein
MEEVYDHETAPGIREIYALSTREKPKRAGERLKR